MWHSLGIAPGYISAVLLAVTNACYVCPRPCFSLERPLTDSCSLGSTQVNYLQLSGKLLVNSSGICTSKLGICTPKVAWTVLLPGLFRFEGSPTSVLHIKYTLLNDLHWLVRGSLFTLQLTVSLCSRCNLIVSIL